MDDEFMSKTKQASEALLKMAKLKHDLIEVQLALSGLQEILEEEKTSADALALCCGVVKRLREIVEKLKE